MAPPLILVSNRGPLSFARDGDGRLVPRSAGGGLAPSLRPLLAGTGATWVAAPMREEDRAAEQAGLMRAEGFTVRTVDVDRAVFDRAYNMVANATLWFLYHGLFDLARRPWFEHRWAEAWGAYREVNRRFAELVAELAPERASVLVQDYHLALVPREVAARRPDVRVVHFSHTPFATPQEIRILPAQAAEDLLDGMSAAHACGFHTARWADAFEACCDEVLGKRPLTFSSSLGPDIPALRRAAEASDVAERKAWVEEMAGGRRLIVRVERLEPSKNLLRGFLAFDELLRAHPELQGEVTLLALAYPSREALAEYRSYRGEVETLVGHVNARWGRSGWTPIVLHVGDDRPRSLAALGRYDVLLVNPVRDGLNLVAKEGPVLNCRDGVVVLSREAGAWSELAEGALEINPFDVAGTAAALWSALTMAPSERGRRADVLVKASAQHGPRGWLGDQLAAAEG